MTAFKKYIKTDSGKKLLAKWNIMGLREYTPCPLCKEEKQSILYELGSSKAITCPSCSFKYISPRLSKKQLRQYYSKIQKNEVFLKDFEGRRHDFLNDREERKRKIRDRHVEIELTNRFTKDGKVLDIGCGSGLYFEGLEGNQSLYGIEISQLLAHYTQERFNADITCGDLDDARYSEGFFDVINMTYVIEHLLDPVRAIKKVYSWLRPGGLLLVSSPNWGGIISKIYKELFRLNDPCMHINLWETGTLKKFLNTSGFTVKHVYYPYFKTEYFNAYEIKRLFRNTVYRILLPIFLKLGYEPPLKKILSPPFRGNIMVFENYREASDEGEYSAKSVVN